MMRRVLTCDVARVDRRPALELDAQRNIVLPGNAYRCVDLWIGVLISALEVEAQSEHRTRPKPGGRTKTQRISPHGGACESGCKFNRTISLDPTHDAALLPII